MSTCLPFFGVSVKRWVGVGVGTNKSTPVDSDVELDSPNLIQFEPKQIEMPVVFRPSVKIRYNNLCIRFGT